MNANSLSDNRDYLGFERLLPSHSSTRGVRVRKALTYILKATWLLICCYYSETYPHRVDVFYFSGTQQETRVISLL